MSTKIIRNCKSQDLPNENHCETLMNRLIGLTGEVNVWVMCAHLTNILSQNYPIYLFIESYLLGSALGMDKFSVTNGSKATRKYSQVNNNYEMSVMTSSHYIMTLDNIWVILLRGRT